ncbi:holin [Lachnospiraceae bacterium ZAX-1]
MKTFVLQTAERAIKTAAQSMIASIGTTSLIGDLQWGIVLSTTGMAVVLSILTSIASSGIGDSTPSLIGKKEE